MSQDREDHADQRLAEELGPAAQAEAAAHEDLDEVVKEADEAEAGHQEQHEHARGGHRVIGEQCPSDVADQRGDDDDDAAHGRRAALAQGRRGLRALEPHLLAELALAQHADRRPGAEQRDDHRDGAGEQDRLHWSSSASRPSATSHRPAAFDAFTSTTSPGRNRFCNSATALFGSGTAIASPLPARLRARPVEHRGGAGADRDDDGRARLAAAGRPPRGSAPRCRRARPCSRAPRCRACRCPPGAPGPRSRPCIESGLAL